MSIEAEKQKLKAAWLKELVEISHLGHDKQVEIWDKVLDGELKNPFAFPVMWNRLSRIRDVRKDLAL